MEQSMDYPKLSEASNIQSAKVRPMRNIWAWGIPSSTDIHNGSHDACLFSSSLPVLPYEKLQGTVTEFGGNMRQKDSMDDLGNHLIGDLLPDDEDELLAGIIGDFETAKLPGQAEELEEYDVFGSSGGMELDYDPVESITSGTAKVSISDGSGNGANQFGLLNGSGMVSGEHPYGEHPSRTLFVRNINSNVDDSELRSLFEPFGDIRSMYTATKHRGFVMISYYDIRAARAAMRVLQNKPLRRRKLDIHFSIPKENPSDKDMNQGTLVIFNLEPAVANEELLRIFGVYGEVREIRETPQKRHHRFIEFYDVRAAEAALRSLNKSDIAGKRVKLEPSRPGGARRNLIQQMTHDCEPDETRLSRFHLGSPLANSPPGLWPQLGSPTEHNQLKALGEAAFGGGMSSLGGNPHSGIPSVYPSMESNSMKIAPIGKDLNRINHGDPSNLLHGTISPFHNSHSFPERGGEIMSGSPLRSSVASSASSASGFGTLNGPQFLWGSRNASQERLQSSALQSPPAGNSYLSNGRAQGQGTTYPNLQLPFGSSERHSFPHHVGSAPSVFPFENNHLRYYPESPDKSNMSLVKFGSIGPSRIGGSHMTNLIAQPYMNPLSAQNGNRSDTSSPNFRTMLPHRWDNISVGNTPFGGPGLIGFEGLVERGRSRVVGNSGGQEDSKLCYQLELEKIISGEDTRTTLMIKNIPNKYTSKMLLEVIDETHEGTYDFFYLPIDFKNKCNVGYAFINMASPAYIISFYKAFNGRKWEKFNSEKVVSLAYARIQGRVALINHFNNSSLMNEDKRCRPMLFDSKCLEGGNQVLLHDSSFTNRQDGKLAQGDLPENQFKDNLYDKTIASGPPGSCSEENYLQ